MQKIIHRGKYTDEEAVAAVNTDDKYVRNYESDTITGDFTATGKIITTDKGNFGNKISYGDPSRALNLISDVAVMKIANYLDSGAPALELFSYRSTSAGGALVGRWDIYIGPHTGSQPSGALYFRDRTTTNQNRFTILSNGNIGIKTINPTTLLDIDSDIIRLRTAKTPATAGAAGNQGDICCDADYIYVCTATNTWKRTAIATW